MNRPLCRWCNKPIAKQTTTVKVERTDADRKYHQGWQGYRYAYADKVMTKADCERLTNQEVTSVSYHTHDTWDDEAGRYIRHRGHIHSFREWDGVSYVDPFFCNGNCCKSFAYAMAKAFPLLPQDKDPRHRQK